MKVESSKHASTARGHSTHASGACNSCRIRKMKCDGVSPVCGPCSSSGHECTWGAESAKRPSTKQCHREHGGLGDLPAYLQTRPAAGALMDDGDETDTSNDDSSS